MIVSSWDDGAWKAKKPLTATARAYVCVVGLGGSGLAVIDTLLNWGVDVIGIDAGSVAAGAAGANGGFLLSGSARFHHHAIETLGRERACELYRLTIQEIERMHTTMPDIVRRVGSLRIAMDADEQADCEQQFVAMTDDGLPVERYRGAEGEGLLIPGDAVFNPLARCRRLAEDLVQRGARLFEHTKSLDIQPGSVQTARGRVHCKHVIVAVDGQLDAVLPELKERVRTVRLQMLGTAPTSEVSIERAVYARWGYEYWQQLPDGRVLLGGFRDYGGDDEQTQSREPSELVQNQLTRFLRDHLKVQAPITHRWAASVGYTDNGLPIMAEVRPKVWAVGGYNGTGNVVGSLCGQAIANVVCDNEAPLFSLLAQ